MRIFKHLLSSVTLLCVCTLSYADTISGKIVAVMDGDTVKMLTHENREIKIRLAEIDAPEKAQAFGQASKKSLSDMSYGKEAKAQCSGSDKYDRYICTIFVNGVNVNNMQVSLGYAWVYRQYATKGTKLYDAESLAKSMQSGLWADDRPVPPWEFRRTN